jgi:hypothetical protein
MRRLTTRPWNVKSTAIIQEQGLYARGGEDRVRASSLKSIARPASPKFLGAFVVPFPVYLDHQILDAPRTNKVGRCRS